MPSLACESVAEEVARQAPGLVHHAIAIPSGETSGPMVRDAGGKLAEAYGFGADAGAFLIRPDGYVSYRTTGLDADRLLAHLALTLKL